MFSRILNYENRKKGGGTTCIVDQLLTLISNNSWIMIKKSALRRKNSKEMLFYARVSSTESALLILLLCNLEDEWWESIAHRHNIHGPTRSRTRKVVRYLREAFTWRGWKWPCVHRSDRRSPVFCDYGITKNMRHNNTSVLVNFSHQSS